MCFNAEPFGCSFQPVFHGTSHGHKVSKLAELTDYHFRLYASNEAGDGPYSCTYKFSTTKAPPPAVRCEYSSELLRVEVTVSICFDSCCGRVIMHEFLSSYIIVPRVVLIWHICKFA